MSRTLKWILGILALLVVVAVVVGAVWVFQSRAQMMVGFRPAIAQPNAQGTPTVPNGPQGFGNNRNRPQYGMPFGGPMMRGRGRGFGFGPFGMGMFFLGGLLRLVIPLAILALVAFLFYQLGRRSVTVRQSPSGPAPSASETSTSAQNPPQAQP